MLRFFRQIRKKLIEQDNVRKYLLYAIGEILLVVIGILIALQVNTWNENRQKQIEERYYMEKLIENIEADSALVVFLKNAQSRILSNIDSALYMMVDESVFETDKFAIHLNSMLAIPTFTQNSVTYDNLIASGKISLITDQQLVNALFTYYDPGNEFIRWDDGLRHYTRNIFGPFILNTYYLTEGGLDGGLVNENYSKLQKPVYTYSSLRENQQLLNYLNMKYRILTGQKQIYTESIAPMQTELLQWLRSDLKKLEN